MTPAYTLCYWPIPFRGQPIRWLLAHAGQDWQEVPANRVAAIKDDSIDAQPVPFMAPPMIEDHESGQALSQMPAILSYLGERHGLMPGDIGRRAVTQMLIANANDVLDEVTLNGGQAMWRRDDWDTFAATRLPRWMAIFEQLGLRHGLAADTGYLLGTEGPGLADLVTGCLWFTMADKLPPVGAVLDRNAPRIAALSRRIAERPRIAAFRTAWDSQHGQVWCGGQIEASLREMLSA